MNKLASRFKEENGNFTILTLFSVLGIIIFAGLFINLTMTYLNINFSKKALEEATRTRALAVDIVMKEHHGVLETISNPYIENDFSALRQSYDFLGNPIPTVENIKYKEAVMYAEDSARQSMMASVDNFIGNTVENEKIIDLKSENICFDIKPLPAIEAPVTFKCAVKAPDGKVYTVEATIPISGYDDANKVNNFDDQIKDISGSVVIDNGKMRVSNVVFGAAVVAPKSLIKTAFQKLGFRDEPNTVLYSVAYPQIDSCYGSFC